MWLSWLQYTLFVLTQIPFEIHPFSKPPDYNAITFEQNIIFLRIFDIYLGTQPETMKVKQIAIKNSRLILQ